MGTGCQQDKLLGLLAQVTPRGRTGRLRLVGKGDKQRTPQNIPSRVAEGHAAGCVVSRLLTRDKRGRHTAHVPRVTWARLVSCRVCRRDGDRRGVPPALRSQLAPGLSRRPPPEPQHTADPHSPLTAAGPGEDVALARLTSDRGLKGWWDPAQDKVT